MNVQVEYEQLEPHSDGMAGRECRCESVSIAIHGPSTLVPSSL